MSKFAAIDTTASALVRRLRRRMKLTQEQFAREVGVSFSTVNQWENGRRQPQPFLMNRLRDLESAAAGKTTRFQIQEAPVERRRRPR